MVSNVRVITDGVEVPRENIRFTVDHIDWFTLDEMSTVSFYKWEYNQPATVRVLKSDELSPGEHEVTLNVVARTAYILIPLWRKDTNRYCIKHRRRKEMILLSLSLLRKEKYYAKK